MCQIQNHVISVRWGASAGPRARGRMLYLPALPAP